MTGGSHGTGWAGIPRYVARQRAANRVAARTAKIEEIAAELNAERLTAVYRAHLLEVLDAMRTAQDADLTLLQELDRADDGPLPPRPPRSTYNGEDEHVAGWEENL